MGAACFLHSQEASMKTGYIACLIIIIVGLVFAVIGGILMGVGISNSECKSGAEETKPGDFCSNTGTLSSTKSWDCQRIIGTTIECSNKQPGAAFVPGIILLVVGGLMICITACVWCCLCCRDKE